MSAVTNNFELIGFLSYRNFIVRYKQTLMGISWCLIRPLLTIIIFTVVFNKIARLSYEDIPYPLFVLSGFLPWQLFSTGVWDMSNSFLNDIKLVRGVYFPRYIIPLSSMAATLFDFLISIILMLLLLLVFYHLPSFKALLVLPFFLWLVIITYSTGLLLAALNTYYRDFKNIIPFILQLGIYASPVGFSSHSVPENWKLWFYLNPLAGIIDGFRLCFLDIQLVNVNGLILSAITTFLLVFISHYCFKKLSPLLADVI